MLTQDKKKIMINDDIYLSSDKNNWIVTLWSNGFNHKTREATRTSTNKYFAKLDSALLYILSEAPKGQESVSGVVSAINKAKEEILQAIKGL